MSSDVAVVTKHLKPFRIAIACEPRRKVFASGLPMVGSIVVDVVDRQEPLDDLPATRAGSTVSIERGISLPLVPGLHRLDANIASSETGPGLACAT